MSYFIANKISISKDRKTFKLKGGDNNVTPRSNGWTDDITIDKLYSIISSGEAHLQDKSEKGCLVNNLIYELNYNNLYENSFWDNETDYYHLSRIKSKEELINILENFEESCYSSYNSNAKEEKKRIIKNQIDNYDMYISQITEFNEMFLKELNQKLDDMKNTNKLKYHLYISDLNAWVYKILPTKTKYVHDKRNVELQKFGFYRANYEINNRENFEKILIEEVKDAN